MKCFTPFILIMCSVVVGFVFFRMAGKNLEQGSSKPEKVESGQTHKPTGSNNAPVVGTSDNLTPGPSTNRQSEDKRRELLSRGEKLLREAKQRDAKFAAKMSEWEFRLPSRSPLQLKVTQSKLETIRPTLQKWGLTAQQISEIENIVSQREVDLTELRQRRLVEPDSSRRRDLSDQSKEVEERSAASLRQIIGDGHFSEFEALAKF